MTDPRLEVVRRWNQENMNPDAVRELVSPDYVAHLNGDQIHGADGWIAFAKSVGGESRDYEAGSDEVIISGDLVGERWWTQYTAADGTSVRWRGMTLHRVSDGRLQEDWIVAEQEQQGAAEWDRS